MRLNLEPFIRFDWTVVLAAMTLTGIGLMAIYGINISRPGGDLFQFQKQLIVAGFGLAVIFASAFLDYRQVRSLALPLYVSGILLLIGVLIFGVDIRGMQGWFVIGNLSFQPVEIAKLLLAVFLAAYLSRHAHKRLGWIPLLGSGAIVSVYVVLVLLQPDFGSAIVMLVMWGAAVAFAGLPRWAWLVFLVAGLAGGTLLWNVGLKPYQRARLASFVNPAADPRGAGYNVTQARIAIGSGGLFGKGVAEGSQSRLRFLPEASTDFVFSVVGEELGFVGVAVVLGLFFLLFYRFISIAQVSGDPFAQIFLVCLVAFMGFHLLENAGMNLGIMPVTGIPLPFVSAAASSLLVSFIALGMVESIAVRRK